MPKNELSSTPSFSSLEKAVLRHLQADLPPVLNPFAYIAHEVNQELISESSGKICENSVRGSPCPIPCPTLCPTLCTEEFVLNFIKSLQEKGVIRRFGASLHHIQAGFKHNALVAWMIPVKSGDAEIEALGKLAAENPHVSHCYYRPSMAEDWPYELFTMLHSQNEKELQRIVDGLYQQLKQIAPPLKPPLILTSLQELKKSSMQYF